MANWRRFTYEGSPSNRTKTAPLDTHQAWGLMLLHYEQLADVVPVAQSWALSPNGGLMKAIKNLYTTKLRFQKRGFWQEGALVRAFAIDAGQLQTT